MTTLRRRITPGVQRSCQSPASFRRGPGGEVGEGPELAGPGEFPTGFGVVGPATGYPVATITEAGALPPKLRFVNNKNGTATISGAPMLKASKTYTITLKASNGVGPVATLKFHLILRK